MPGVPLIDPRVTHIRRVGGDSPPPQPASLRKQFSSAPSQGFLFQRGWLFLVGPVTSRCRFTTRVVYALGIGGPRQLALVVAVAVVLVIVIAPAHHRPPSDSNLKSAALPHRGPRSRGLITLKLQNV